jgi:hypothetical protein
MVSLFLFLKGMTGALAPFSYLEFIIQANGGINWQLICPK